MRLIALGVATCALLLCLVLWRSYDETQPALDVVSRTHEMTGKDAPFQEVMATAGALLTPPPEQPTRGPDKREALRQTLGVLVAMSTLNYARIESLAALKHPTADDLEALVGSRTERDSLTKRIADKKAEIAAFDVDAEPVDEALQRAASPPVKIVDALSRGEWGALVAEHFTGRQLTTSVAQQIDGELQLALATIGDVTIPSAFSEQAQLKFLPVVDALLSPPVNADEAAATLAARRAQFVSEIRGLASMETHPLSPSSGLPKGTMTLPN